MSKTTSPSELPAPLSAATARAIFDRVWAGMPPKRLAVYGAPGAWDARVRKVAALFTGDELRAWVASEREKAARKRSAAFRNNGGSDLHAALRGVSHTSEGARLAAEAAAVADRQDRQSDAYAFLF
jgi:hypothetical protein